MSDSYHRNGDNRDTSIYHHVNNDDGLVPGDIQAVFDTDDVRGEKQHQSLNGVRVVDIDDANRSSNGSLSTTLVVAVGCAGALVALLLIGTLIAMCRIRRRRRRNNRLYKGSGGLGVPVETYALVQTPSMRRHRQPGDPLPPPDTCDAADDVIVVAVTPGTSRADSVQRRAWETMLDAAQSAVDDVAEFDCYSDDEVRDVTTSPVAGRAVLKYTPRRADSIGRKAGYGSTDDGLYHSGVPVDDVIERIDSSSRTSQLYTTPRNISSLHKR
jgi:hypothetical protein